MIRILEKSVADKIAAGEVVDRPLSVVKELVENSIDAKATGIVIEIRAGGKEYIRVTDDGIGIAAEELNLAFVRHATSKIVYEDDLERIYTLGFRGEALASIAAVSKVTLISKTASEKTGALVRVTGGEMMEIAKIGSPQGSSIVVSDLFFNVPARLSFLKSTSAEAALIIDFVSKIALAYSHIKFRLINNGDILFATNGKNDKYKNILNIYSKDYANRMLKVFEDNEYMSIEAYISKPDLTKSNRRNQIFFVNGRAISSKVLDIAVMQGYKERLFEGRYPIVFLFLNIDPKYLDVNIHPNKKEVRFHDDEKVSEFVSSAIRKKLATLNASPGISKKNIEIETVFKEPLEYVKLATPLEPVIYEDEIQVERGYSEAEFIKEDLNLYEIRNECPEVLNEEQIDIKNILSTISKEEIEKEHRFEETEYLEEKRFDLRELKILSVVFNTYIVAQFEDKIYFIDQHAAHERVFYEKFLNEYKSSEKMHQSILIPFIREVIPSLKAIENIWLPLLEKLGFTIQEFGDRTYRITEIPVFMQLQEAEAVLDYFLENIKEGTDIDNFVKIDKLIMRSCKSAVKGGDSLSIIECEELIKLLANCENPYSCPHGRPTFIKLSKNEIEKMFKRI
ncbi:MAG: DNA mismatch repair endonuclease MutL [Eubacteriales bacterium]